jgi:hypothetical protein
MSTYLLLNRAALRRAFYALLNTDANDAALIEHEAAGDDTANRYLQQGLWSAQGYIVTFGDANRWLVEAPVDFSAEDNGRAYMPLPERLLRLAGDEESSAMYNPTDGQEYGRLIPTAERNRIRGQRAYYLLNDRIYLVADAPLPDPGSVVAFNQLAAPITDDDLDFDFPLEFRELVVAYAGQHAISDAWPLGGDEMERKVLRKTAYWEAEVVSRSRRTRQAKRFRGRTRRGTPPGYII